MAKDGGGDCLEEDGQLREWTAIYIFTPPIRMVF